MKLFLDTADTEALKKALKTAIVDGVTVNPTILKQAQKNPTVITQELISLFPHGIIHIQVTETEPNNIYQQAKKLAALSKNIVVKIPCHKNNYTVIHKLKQERIAVNATVLFTLAQGLYMAKLGVDYVSPYVGRLDDAGKNGIELLHDLRMTFDFYNYKTQILAASLRTVEKYNEAILAGVDATTIPLSVFEETIDNNLTNDGIKKFTDYWQTINVTEFP